MWTILPQLWNIWEKSEQFSARTSSLNRKSIQFSQFPLPVPCKRSSAVPIPFGVGFQFLGHAVSLRQLRHDQLHAVSCRFVNLSAILSYVHPAIWRLFLCLYVSFVKFNFSVFADWKYTPQLNFIIGLPIGASQCLKALLEERGNGLRSKTHERALVQAPARLRANVPSN